MSWPAGALKGGRSGATHGKDAQNSSAGRFRSVHTSWFTATFHFPRCRGLPPPPDNHTSANRSRRQVVGELPTIRAKLRLNCESDW